VRSAGAWQGHDRLSIIAAVTDAKDDDPTADGAGEESGASGDAEGAPGEESTPEPQGAGDAAGDDAGDGASGGGDSAAAGEPEPESEWAAKARRALELWEVGDNASLRRLVAELEGAPEHERAARDVAAEMRRRLRPDPVAIGLWLATLAVFCFLTYWFVVR
jgi:hypothetical protein